jgi:hypothetical protein
MSDEEIPRWVTPALLVMAALAGVGLSNILIWLWRVLNGPV